ncbi:hypothetical protein CYMTET_13703, partial [Cymbomonas tetramitiformis]
VDPEGCEAFHVILIDLVHGAPQGKKIGEERVIRDTMRVVKARQQGRATTSHLAAGRAPEEVRQWPAGALLVASRKDNLGVNRQPPSHCVRGGSPEARGKGGRSEGQSLLVAVASFGAVGGPGIVGLAPAQGLGKSGWLRRRAWETRGAASGVTSQAASSHHLSIDDILMEGLAGVVTGEDDGVVTGEYDGVVTGEYDGMGVETRGWPGDGEAAGQMKAVGDGVAMASRK